MAEPSLTGRVIAAWPSFALTVSWEPTGPLMARFRPDVRSRASTIGVNAEARLVKSGGLAGKYADITPGEAQAT